MSESEKAGLHAHLRSARDALVWKVEGLSEAVELTTANADDPGLRRDIQRILREFNTSHRVELPDAVPLTVAAHASDGSFLGGCVAATYWGWLVVDVLAVEERARGGGLGTRLIDEAENEARRRGVVRAQANAYDFQGLAFWLGRGYRIVGELPDFPPGHATYWLCRDL